MTAKYANASETEGWLRVTLKTDDTADCPPQDVLAVIDISGSMDASCAGVQDGRTVYVDLGFSLLDLVKHAIKSIIGTLRNQDRLAVVVFDD